jgi:nucleoside-diphosphate-sugar epimerase
VNACFPYAKSKRLAEGAAWDYHKSIPEQDAFELITINPTLILGPVLIESDFSSGVVIQKIMTGAFPGMPKVQVSIVDVRDAALAHLRAIKIPEARNSRFIVHNESIWLKDLAIILQNHYGRQYPIKTGDLRYCTLKLAGCFDPAAKFLVPIWGKEMVIINDKSKRILGIEYHDLHDTLLAASESMIDAGYIKDKRRKN